MSSVDRPYHSGVNNFNKLVQTKLKYTMELPGVTDRLLPDTDREDDDSHYRVAVNLDQFFSDMYTHFYSHGLPAIILTQLCSLVSLCFTVVLSIILIGFVDWNKLLTCEDEATCHELSAYINAHHFEPFTFYSFLILLYICLFGLYWLWNVFKSIQIVIRGVEMERVYRWA